MQAVLKYIGHDECTGVISDEIGGGNGIQPMIIAAEMGKVVLDVDLMGRAYPNVCLPCSDLDAVYIPSRIDVPDVSTSAEPKMLTKLSNLFGPLQNTWCLRYSGRPHAVRYF